jgi:hypothetical protein
MPSFLFLGIQYDMPLDAGQGDLIVFYDNKNAPIHIFDRVSHIRVAGTTKYPALCHTRRVKEEAYQKPVCHFMRLGPRKTLKESGSSVFRRVGMGHSTYLAEKIRK